MHIKRLIIQGFKSYKKKVIIDFHEGQNCIVGKNGSGKSNIYAALEFVLGGKYNMLRQEQRKQLLHDAGQSGVVSAYVEVIFDNTDGRFPEKTEQVSLKRSIGSKKDEYFVNGKHYTKQDVENLLESAGISKTNQYFIIKQGKVSARVREKDSDRLSLIKEIAGTRIYDERRKESTKIMNNAENKEQKVKMIIDYFLEKLEELSGETKEFNEFTKLENKKKLIEYYMYNLEKEKINNELEKLDVDENEDKENSDKKEYNEISDNIQILKNNINDNTFELTNLTKKKENNLLNINPLHNKIQSIQRNIKTLELNLNLDKENIKSMNKNKPKFIEYLNDIKDKITKEQHNLNKIIPIYENLKQNENNLKNNIKLNKDRLNDLYSKQGRLGLYKTKKERNKYLNNEINDYKNEINEEKEQLTKLNNDINNINNDITNENNKLNKYLNELNEINKTFEQLTKNFDKKKNERNKLQNERKKYWKEENSLKELINETENNLKHNENDLRNTMNWSMYTSYTSTKIIIDNNKDTLLKDCTIYGPVIELFDCDKKYFISVEATAQNKLFYWIVDNDVTATKCINLLKKNKCGRVTFIPLNKIKEKLFEKKEYPRTTDVLPIINTLKFNNEILEPAFLQIFGNTLIVRDLNIGYEFSMRDKYQCVTLHGDLINSYGGMQGGYNEGKYRRLKYMNVIKSNKNNLQEYKTKLNDLTKNLITIEQKLTIILNETKKNEKNISFNRNRKNILNMDIIKSKNTIANYEELKLKKNEYVKKIENKITNLNNKISELEKEKKLDLNSNLTENEEKEINDLRELNNNLTNELNELIPKLINNESIKIESESKLKNILIPRKEKLEKDIMEQCDDIQIKEYELKIDRIENEISEKTNELNKLTENLNEMEDENKNIDNNINKFEKIINNNKTELIKLENKITNLTRKQEKIIGKKEGLNEQIKNLDERIRNLGSLPSIKSNEYKTINKLYKTKKNNELKKELIKINKELSKYSNVNKKAVNQYKLFLEQKNALSDRHEKKLRDKIHIEELMEQLDLKKDDAILKTFESINKHFKKVFQELVPRGKGKLLLYQKEITQDEDSDNENSNNNNKRKKRSKRRSSQVRLSQTTNNDKDNEYKGVGFEITFNDRNVDDDEKEGTHQSMNQLSGGQQTVVALALIFAIQRCDPSPFYVFDEIDAALDQQYRRAVAEMIDKMKGENQFIITTFQKELVESSDKCFVVEFKNRISTIKTIENPQEVDLTKFQ